MELSEYDAILKHLVAIAQRQDALNHQHATTNRRLEETMHDIKSFVQQQHVANTQHTTIVMRMARTLDLIEEKLGQMLPPHAA